METLEFKSNLQKRKKLLKAIAKTDPSWKVRIRIAITAFIVAALILIATGAMLIRHPIETYGMFIFTASGIMIASAPFFIAVGVKK